MTIECFCKTVKAVANIRLAPLGVETEVTCYYSKYNIANIYITYTTNYCAVRSERISIATYKGYCITGIWFMANLNKYVENIRYTRAHYLTCLALTKHERW